MAPAPELSVIVPAYNAARFLKDSVLQIERCVKRTGAIYEILIVENASTDNTPQIAAELAKRKTVRHLTNKLKGRGRALNKGFTEAKGVYVVYTDADLDIPLKYIFEIVRHLKEGYDIAVASKRHPQSHVHSPLHRTIPSRIHKSLSRGLLNSKLHGHQGGLKGFKTRVIRNVLPFVEDGGWFWDTEVLVIAQWQGHTIKEVPIVAEYGFEGTSLGVKERVKLFFGGLLLKMLRLRLRERRLKRKFDKSR